ncbi:MAG: ABC transporter permease [Bdellovibrionota bacterium]
MPLREIILLAFEALYVNKLRSILTMLGMIIGVGAVVLLVSIGNGAKNYVTSEFQGLGTNLIVIQPGRTDSRTSFGPPIGSSQRPLTLADADALEKQALNLEAVTGVLFGAGTLKHENKILNAQILGASEKLGQIFNIPVEQGQYFAREEAETGRRLVILGNKVSKNFFGDENPLGRLIRIMESEHRVTGVLEKSGEKLGFNLDNIVIIPTKSAMRIFNEDKLFGIRAKAKSLVALEDAVEEIKSILKQRHAGNDDFTIVTQVSMLATMNTILGMLTYVLAGIAMISMIVGGIGIMNIMLVSVTERTREIGIRRAVGARRRDILAQFLAEAMVLAMAGGATGIAGSVLITQIISLLAGSFDMRAPAWILPPAFLLSVLTGVLFGVWPARRASMLETIEALRYE